jgi:nucleotide-binding universal stress UspA family protein
MYQRILVAIDGSTVSHRALQEAIKLAQDQRARLRIIHVVDLGPIYDAAAGGADVTNEEQMMITEGRNLLASAKALAQSAGVTSETALLMIYGTGISDAIVDDAKLWPADLIVLGTHGRHGLTELLLGSVAEGVVHIAPVPVLLVGGLAHLS